MRKLIIASEISKTETLAKIGWDGIFVGWDSSEGVKLAAEEAKRCNMILQSVHAPFHNNHLIWEDSTETGENAVNEQINCVRGCAEAGVDLVVMHAVIGMERCTPTELGTERFGRIFDEAGKLGVRIAVENTEGEVYLERLLNAFPNEKHVGFCIDTGHEMCYNYSHDMIGKYGSRLFCTHLNDNMGITGGKITWQDDSHMLPFDGKADWSGIAQRLNKAGYRDMLTFELTQSNKPGRHTSDSYEKMTFDEFYTEAFVRAVRFAELIG